MKKTIVINSTANERRIAILEDGKLAELFVDIPGKERLVGDIYFGKVARVMPGIRAAFLDVGLQQDAFLHFSDIGSSLQDYNSMFGDEVDEGEDEGEENGNGNGRVGVESGRSILEAVKRPAAVKAKPDVNITKGQELLVQITKEPTGNKGVRVTSEISLPGRFLVLMPYGGKVGVSKKMTNFKERRRLRRLVRDIIPENYGAIIRTVAENATEDLLKQDLDELIKTWKTIEKTVKGEQAPSLIYKDLNTTSSVIRDLFSENVSQVAVDDKKLYKEVRSYLQVHQPDMVDRLELYKGKEPIFDQSDIEKDIRSMMSRKVWLKTGGYIYIEKTEAMTVIDVNSGRYAANKEQEMNSLKTNLEASREICRQLRLRDIGGLIIVDFIDLEDEKNRKKIYDEMKKELRRDRAKVSILPMTEFGLIQITRQRIRQNVQLSFSEACPTCGGGGVVVSKESTVNRIERWIKRFRSETHEFRLLLKVPLFLEEYLLEGTFNRLRRMQIRYLIRIKLEVDNSLAIDDFRFISLKQNKDLTGMYSV